MTAQLKQAIDKYINVGYRMSEQLSSTSVVLQRKKLLRKKHLFLWLDENSKVQASHESFKALVRRLSENVRLQRILDIKVSWTEKGTSEGLFKYFLNAEYAENRKRLVKLKKEKSKVETEIRLRSCLGTIVAPLRREVERCLGEGYEVKIHTDRSVILKRFVGISSGAETLKLYLDSAGKVQRDGERLTTMQGRLDKLIDEFKMYRKGYIPGAEKINLDMQFKLDAEIHSLYREMKYLGYNPNVGDYIL